MSPEAGEMLMGEIAPRLRSAIPKVVYPVGAEDEEELVQDAIVLAARMLDNVERAGKKVTPGNIAYYTILHMKSGRRSQSAARTDAMGQGTQLDHNSCVLSMEEEVGYDPEVDEAITLGDLLACHHEDPASAASRNVDWDEFLGTHDYRYGVVVKGLLDGSSLGETSKACGTGYMQLQHIRVKLAEELEEFMGSTAIMDALRVPTWRANITADRERAACKADRRRR